MGKDATELNGQWVQNNITFPLKWERIDQPFAITKPDNISYDPPATAKDIRGYWLGSLEVGQASLRLGLKVGKTPDGSLVGSMDSLDQGVRDLPMSQARFTNATSTAFFEWKALNASYVGKLDKKGEELTGNYKQGGQSMPLTFKRAAMPK